MLVLGAIPKLVKLATQDENQGVRKKAIRALSCGSRNYQPNLDAIIANLPKEFKPTDKLDAGDMESVDSLIEPLRTSAQRVN
jgi:oligoendopeptidase F